MPVVSKRSSTGTPPQEPCYEAPRRVAALLGSTWLSGAFLCGGEWEEIDPNADLLETVFVITGATARDPRSRQQRSHPLPWLLRARQEVAWPLDSLLQSLARSDKGDPEDVRFGRCWLAGVAYNRFVEEDDEVPPLIAGGVRGHHTAVAEAYACRVLDSLTVGDLRRHPELCHAVAHFLAEGRAVDRLERSLVALRDDEGGGYTGRVHGNRLALRALGLEGAAEAQWTRVDAALEMREGSPAGRDERGAPPTAASEPDLDACSALARDNDASEVGVSAPPAAESYAEQVQRLVGQAFGGLIGLDEVREHFEDLCWEVFGYRAHVAAGGAPPRPSALHLALVGPPGVGKTTVAKRYAELLHALGLICRDHVEVVGARDLIGKYIGSTHPRVLTKAKEAKGGVLFIDEAYALVGGGERDYGSEAITALMQAMDTYGDELVVVLAGYERPLQRMLNTNPGFASRMGTTLRLRPLDPEQAGQLLLAVAELDGVEMEPGVLTSWLDLGMVFELPSDGRAIDLLWQRLRRRVIAPRAARRGERMRLRVLDLAELALPRRPEAIDPRWVARVGPDDEASS